MNNFFKVVGFELNNYFKSKAYILTTVLITAFLIVGICLPSMVDLSGIIPQLATEEKAEEDEKAKSEEDKSKYAIYDENNIIDMEYLKSFYPNSEWQTASSNDELEKLVKDGQVEGGFEVESLTKYTYFVKNKGLHDSEQAIFDQALGYMYKQQAISEKGLDFNEIDAIYNMPIESNVNVLGKDSSENYFYAYILVFILYFMIIMYGQLIATSVASEKSSRAMEVLVTSTSTNSLIFGKVIAGTIASVIQVGVMLGGGVITYKITGAAWNGMLDNFLAIPANILLTFSVFGFVGYIFYSFIYAALGALVSKTEDIGKSIGSINFIFMIGFFIAIFGLMNPDNVIVKVASYVPFTSCMTIVTRVALGSISIMEMIVSAFILIVSTLLVGVLASKIYRMGTLRYGNPIKLTHAIKSLRKKED